MELENYRGERSSLNNKADSIARAMLQIFVFFLVMLIWEQVRKAC